MSSDSSSDEQRQLLPESTSANQLDQRKTDKAPFRRVQSEIIRRPVQYESMNSQYDVGTSAVTARYRYYNRLAPYPSSSLVMPDHVLPAQFYSLIPTLTTAGKESSIVTIFALWNTMMGTSLLSMPWAIQQAGFALGIGIMLIMCGLTFYTAYIVMTSVRDMNVDGEVLEFSDVCRMWLGKPAEILSVIFSAIALVGALIVYWVLMSNFLYHTGQFAYNQIHHHVDVNHTDEYKYNGAYCPQPPIIPPDKNSSERFEVSSPFMGYQNYIGSMLGDASLHDKTFNKYWNMITTVPFYLIIIILPLVNFKSPTFFTKFNVLGSLSVAYLTFFTIYQAIKWGINANFNSPRSLEEVKQAEFTFPKLTGTCSLAYFIHNCVLSITRNAKQPDNNGRDLCIAYALVCLTYMFVGTVFFITFPLTKLCIEANLLDNFVSTDVLAFVARIGLFFQMLTVLPLIFYIIRVQLMHIIFKSIYPSLVHVLVLNLILIAICVMFARFLPNIGIIISFSGALCGLAYIFALPCAVYIMSEKAKGKLTPLKIAFHGALIFLGLANFVAQFVLLKFK